MYEENSFTKTTPPPPITPIKTSKTTTIEKTTEETLEEYETRKRMMRAKYKDDNKWNVRLRKISINEDHDNRLEWENFSDISSVSNMTMTSNFDRSHFSVPIHDLSNERKEPLFSPDLVGTIDNHNTTSSSVYTTREISDSKDYISQYNIPLENNSVINWDVLIRVFQDDKYTESNVDKEMLTVSDKMIWKRIIMNESSLRSELSTAASFDDFSRISSDKRYKNLFDPHKWEVIIQLLSLPHESKYKSFNSTTTTSSLSSSKRTDSETYSRQNSLPTLYEHDSDKMMVSEKQNETVHKKSYKKSYRGEADLRSVSEMTVDFDRIDPIPEHQSNTYSSNNREYLGRTSSQPSLVRSASEFTELWLAPEQESEVSSIYSIRKPNRGVNKGKRMLSGFEERKSYQNNKNNSNNWFDDNESESSYRF